MSAEADLDLLENGDHELIRRCSVVSIYEQLGDRDLLVDFCRSLAMKFRDELEFQFDWWRFKYLTDRDMALEAARSAARADMVFLSTNLPQLPDYVGGWFDTWVSNRIRTDGALVLVQNMRHQPADFSGLENRLGAIARRGGLDYLRVDSSTLSDFPLLQPGLNEPLNEDQPMHWGINE